MNPEPRLLDVRAGLTEEALDGLRAAQRVSVAVKDARTAAIAFWVNDQLSIALVRCDAQTLLRIPRVMLHPPVGPRLVRALPRRLEGVLLDIPQAQQDSFWSRVTSVLRVGDVIRIAADSSSLKATLFIEVNGAQVAGIRLPSRASEASGTQPAA